MTLRLRRPAGSTPCLLLLLAGFVACTGRISRESGGSGDPGSGADPGSVGMNASGNKAGGRGGSAGGPVVMLPGSGSGGASASCTVGSPGFVALRRLTRTQYNRTVADLLGEPGQPAAVFPADDTVLADQSQVSSLLFEKHEAAVEKMVADAWQREVQGKQPAGVKLQVCALKNGDNACARSIVSAFARRAWRRPVSDEELMPFVNLLDTATSNGDDLATGVQLALRGLLLAPDFLFRVEADAKDGARPLNDHELAVRLSYWLWSSTPDAHLDALADAGKLTDLTTLAQEISRLLGDGKANAFAQDFSDHWLTVSEVLSATPDKTRFPTFTPALADSMRNETVGLFSRFVTSDRKALDMLDADFSVADEALAQHYGVTWPGGSGTRDLALPASPRRGLLANASLLTLTSPATHTSPVRRGKFVLAKLLCDKPPPPPPGVNTKLPEPGVDHKTARQQLEAHRANPTCASCHKVIDPIGLGLEHFDPVGRYRDQYEGGSAIDVSGELAGSGSFSTFEQLRDLIKKDPRFTSCLTRQMFIYAIGREPTEGQDDCAQERIKQTFDSGGRVVDLIAAIAGNPTFLQRRGVAAGGTP